MHGLSTHAWHLMLVQLRQSDKTITANIVNTPFAKSTNNLKD